MQTFIFIILLIIIAVLMVVGFKNEDGTDGNQRLGRLLIAAGFGVLAVAGLVVYGVDSQQGWFSIGIAGLLSMAYVMRALRAFK